MNKIEAKQDEFITHLKQYLTAIEQASIPVLVFEKELSALRSQVEQEDWVCHCGDESTGSTLIWACNICGMEVPDEDNPDKLSEKCKKIEQGETFPYLFSEYKHQIKRMTNILGKEPHVFEQGVNALLLMIEQPSIARSQLKPVEQEQPKGEKYPVIAIDDIDVETVKRWFQLFMGFSEDSRMKADIRAMARASALNRHINWEEQPKDILTPDLNKAWPTKDVLTKLVWATEYLLHEKNYDGHGHEELQICVRRGKEIIESLDHSQFSGEKVTDEMIEKWAKLLVYGTLIDVYSDDSIMKIRYKALIEGAKALRDGLIK